MPTPNRTPGPRRWPQQARRVAGLGASSLTALPRLGSWVVTRAGSVARRQLAEQAARRRTRVETLPSLYDRYPAATTASRLSRGVTVVPLDRIVGTERHPSQNTADFKPLPQLRGGNWTGRWQRINRALDTLVVLPPVDLVKVGDEYYVSDGHNRVAAAREAGAVGIDADVTEIVIPGVDAGGPEGDVASSLAAGAMLRDAGSGRLSRTAVPSRVGDVTTRREMLRARGPNAERPGGSRDEE